MAKVAGRFHEVEAWNGIPGTDIEADIAARLKALGVPVHESVRYVPDDVLVEDVDAPPGAYNVRDSADSGGFRPFYRVAAPLAALARWHIDLAAWAYRAYGDGAELDAICRLFGSQLDFLQHVLNSKREDDVRYSKQIRLETDDGSET